MSAAEEVEKALHSDITELVESYWRAFLTLGPKTPPQDFEVIANFDSRIKAFADELNGAHGEAFLAAVARERARMLQEFQSDPAALRSRLGIPAPASIHPCAGAAGQEVERPAVRATVWESVRALFRASR